jgi:hypothetical protein
MAVDARAQIERRDADQIGLPEAEPAERIDERERLDRLLRVEVEPFGLVGESRPGPTMADAADALGTQRPLGRDRFERLVEREVGGEPRVRRQPPVAVDRGVGVQRAAPVCRAAAPIPRRAGSGRAPR